MTPYYEGTSEAEQLVRAAPELVDAWLKKARQDRRRLVTRWFQPQRRDFLDGFIQSLETFLAHSTMDAAPPGPQDSRVSEATIDSPAVEGRPFDGVPEPEPPSLLPAAEPGTPSEDAAGPTLEPSEDMVELAVDLEPARPRVLASSGESLDRPPLSDPVAGGADGIVRLEGWMIDVDPQGVGSSHLGEPAVEPVAPAVGFVSAVPWDQVFEPVRGVAMVDLSAYDVLDGLGELRNLIDHWQHLRQDPPGDDHAS